MLVMTQPPGSVPPPGMPPQGMPPGGTPPSGVPGGMPPGGMPPPPGAPPRRGWFGRNWKWFIPLVVVLPIIVCCGGITAVVGGVFGMLKSSDPYKHAIAQAQSHPQVTAALGTPVEPTFFVGGTVNVNGNSGNAELVIPIKGPKGAGTLFVTATKSGGVWTYQTLDFQQTGSAQRIDLKGGP